MADADLRRWSYPGSGLEQGPSENRKEFRLWSPEEVPQKQATTSREAGLKTDLSNAGVLDDVFKCHYLKVKKEDQRRREKAAGGRERKQLLNLDSHPAEPEEEDAYAGISTDFTNAQLMKNLMMDDHIKKEIKRLRNAEGMKEPQGSRPGRRKAARTPPAQEEAEDVRVRADSFGGRSRRMKERPAGVATDFSGIFRLEMMCLDDEALGKKQLLQAAERRQGDIERQDLRDRRAAQRGSPTSSRSRTGYPSSQASSRGPRRSGTPSGTPGSRR